MQEPRQNQTWLLHGVLVPETISGNGPVSMFTTEKA
jgi:hypothetical protein